MCLLDGSSPETRLPRLEASLIFVGIDWSEQHHDIEVRDPDGAALARARVADELDGIGSLHALLADHADDPAQVVIGIESDRGLLVGSLVAAGYQVFAVNPKSVDRSETGEAPCRDDGGQGSLRHAPTHEAAGAS